jgi:hypothetical protein
LNSGKKIQAAFAVFEHVVEQQRVRLQLREQGERGAAGLRAREFEFPECVLVDFVLQIVVLDDE